MRPKVFRIFIIFIVDGAIMFVSAIMPLILRFGIFDFYKSDYFDTVLGFLPLDIGIAFIVLALFRLYTRVWSFAGFSELIAVVQATVIIEAIYIMYHVVFQIHLPRSFYPIQLVSLLILLGGSRVSVRFYRQVARRDRTVRDVVRVMVVGAGAAGSALANEINYQTSGRRVVCFTDDNRNKIGKYINGVLIAGNRDDIPALIDKYFIQEIIIAIPSANSSEIRQIINICREVQAKLKILPGIANGMMETLETNVRDVNYQDLLGRNKIEIHNEALAGFFEGKTVMVTGAGGSIGSELCKQIIANKPAFLIMLDIYENNLHDLYQELMRNTADMKYIPLIASIRDTERLTEIFKKYRPHIIFHAAAHKHVPLMEGSPCEAVKNNCGGTLTLATLADQYKVEHFVFISTDKAVRPTNVMGATKRICEMIVQTVNQKSDTRFVSVRFGNVLGSNGSVVPLFLKQIEEGGPVTVTHREVTRFFMTIPEAVYLVLQACVPNKEGELFVLDMGEPVKIYDLAVNLIKLKGFVPNKDIKIEFTGLRSGEKLYEELLLEEEGLEGTQNVLIFTGRPAEINERDFFNKLNRLLSAADVNSDTIKDEISKVCETYRI